MTGRFVYWMNVSLDLRIESEAGEDGGGDWMRIGESLHREFNARARALALMVQGRKVYEIMDPFWPDARDDASLPDYLREYGQIWTAARAHSRSGLLRCRWALLHCRSREGAQRRRLSGIPGHHHPERSSTGKTRLRHTVTAG